VLNAKRGVQQFTPPLQRVGDTAPQPLFIEGLAQEIEQASTSHLRAN
jgi:hypothetical protein